MAEKIDSGESSNDLGQIPGLQKRTIMPKREDEARQKLRKYEGV